MKKIVFYLVLAITSILAIECTFNNVYINRETDNNDGKVMLNKFYNQIANKNFDATDPMLVRACRAFK